MADPTQQERILAELSQLTAMVRTLLAHTLDRPPTDDRSLTTVQAAEYLGLHPKTLSKYRRTGRVQGYQDRDGGHWRYRRTDLDLYRQGLTARDRHHAPQGRDIDWGA